MELSLDTAVTEKSTEVIGRIASQRPEWNAALARVRAYLAAWRLGDGEWIEDCAREILPAAQQRVQHDTSLLPIQATIEEADAFLARWLRQFQESSTAHGDGPIPLEMKSALLFGTPPDAPNPLSDALQLRAALRQGTLNFSRARAPSRPPETRAFNMQTSLSRLPSIRLIGGWLLLISLLFLAFFLTH